LAVSPKKNFDIKNLTSFKIGGKVNEVFFPETVQEFVQIIKDNSDVKVFGNLSNTLISSKGYNGKIILTTKMNNIRIDGARVVAGCGVKGPKLSQVVSDAGLSGLEFMIGFPGSIGGEVFMNASAHGQNISDNLTFVTCYCVSEQKIVRFSKEEMGFGYRTSRCGKDNLIVLEAEFELTKKSIDEIKLKMEENLDFRKSHQPSLALPNCGSVFKNPKNDSAGRLLDSIGAKDTKCGGVRVWENHANFIVNDNNGTSSDVLELMVELYTKVKNKYNIELEPEVIFLGSDSEKENELCKILYKIK